jgi:DNA-binding MarR family transcriptional regulator
MQSDKELIDALQAGLHVFMHRSMRNVIRFAKESGLSMSQMGALFHIDRQGACGVSDIGDDLGISHAASSQMLERLVQQELITRSEDPHDRRLKHIVLTDKGSALLHDSLQARQSWLTDLANSLDDDEKQQVLAALTLLLAKARQLDETPEAVG